MEIIGLVARDFSKWPEITAHFSDVPLYNDFKEAFDHTKPDAVIISSYTDTHALYATLAMQAGADVFVEKPLALNKREAGYTIATARKFGRKLCVGYILRHHEMWQKFIKFSKTLGKPVNVKITSNQHSTGAEWQLHKNILNAGLSPLVDCGIHYADVMTQISKGEVVDIKAKGRKTSGDMLVANDASMLITYSDGATLNFQSGFGPDIDPSDERIVKAEGPLGEVIITADNTLIHKGKEFIFSAGAYDISIEKQQKYFFDAIKKDINLDKHWQDVAMSHAIVLIAEEEMNN